jgi:hypothetical protein
MKDLVPFEDNKKDAFTRIMRFYQKSDIMLDPDEEIILNRWAHCDRLMKARIYTTEKIIEQLVKMFGVSKYTAQNDIRHTQALYGAVRQLDRNYLLAGRIEHLELLIQEKKDDPEWLLNLPRLEAELNKLILALPAQVAQDRTPSPNITINVVNGQEAAIAGALTFEQAKELLQQKKKQQHIEDIDHEEV